MSAVTFINLSVMSAATVAGSVRTRWLSLIFPVFSLVYYINAVLGASQVVASLLAKTSGAPAMCY